ncbi:two-component system sensor histidine kinase KdpD [Xenorhabdus griffiniae]|uniref:histidine kinase n=1 Tax=Xenorhabdus griffiniae TaxID=351672 RepID=A0ABY9XE38_9GAMM|nr:two-component system sensor histidine kinase KdpD [Xenorhabdus griffiniae]MBD1226126.1 two-component system sensor histidine kinase KdbD [Xenorhabdus griffiniae]MBE8585997.1 two-component system sensor histidine kinase KdpD [Xenorhabdus griffiniae]WMV71189.1 two-component system sensor histidine kinase KdpD [Xenorhabdus griffiniae]WNH00865.1 two-component system sensor histidine kinase KdpD [Xenorhabdus griffiniae]
MEHNEPQRPDPDELLTLANEKPRGKLKIFFGACAGVGKTYAMLQEAQRLLAQGLDVIVGVVETHDRSETAALLKGLPRLPAKYFRHNERRIAAFDIDAALARHPAIILMDELAFSNPKGSRHPKRWQDVEELLEAGIDVLTTINVQHLESLNDVVGGITGIRVRETVPDHIFDQADDVVLVDLPPDDLRQRLNDGKVYISGQAERAIEHFFRKGNLIALRELALRRTADRVDDQMRAFRDTRGKEPVWHTQENLLLCIGYNAGNEKLVRKAARLAAKLNCTWHAVYVETPKLHRLPEGKRRTILQALKLAQDLGAETATLSDSDEEKAVLRYAREHNLGKILIGRYYNSQVNFFGFKWYRDFSERLGKLGPDLDLIIVALEDKKNGDKEPKDNRTFNDKWRAPIQGFLMAIVLCALITLFSRTFLLTLDKANLVALYLLGVVIIALFYGRWPSVFAAFVNVISFDLFFVQPRWSLEVKNIQYLLTLAVMLIVGAVVGNLTAGIRYQARVARYREQRTRHLYEITRTLSKALNEEDVARISYYFLSNSFQAKTGLLLPDNNQRLYQVKSHNGGQMQIDEAIAKWCFEKKQPAGAGTDTLPGVPYQLLPIATPSQVFAVLAIESPNQRQLLVPEQQRLLQIFTGLIANALERLHLTRSAESARLETEREQLRNSLLAALSHDLLTPLTVLFGQAEILMLDLSTENSPHTQQVNQIRQQILSLSRLVNNLLDMARLQSGGIQLNLEWCPLEEIVSSALRSLEHTLNRNTVALSLPNNVLLHCDATLLERVFINLLENSIKYTSEQTPLGIQATIEEKTAQKQVHIEIWDTNTGIPPEQEKLIFDKFSRTSKESAIPGVGLGLAICQSIIEIHGGKIWAANNQKGGTSFHFLLPLQDPPDLHGASAAKI